MNGAFYIAATGLDAQQKALDVTANNVANVNTTGFKRSAVRFRDLVAQNGETGLPSLPTSAHALGVSATGEEKVWEQGSLRQTGNVMDIAIDGAGFIEMMGPSGKTLLWRGGTLKVNSEGYLVAADGTQLRAMISVPQEAKSIAFAEDGSVTATLDGEDGSVSLGRIDLFVAKDKADLTDLGGGYYSSAGDAEALVAEPGEEGAGRLVQGSLEGANVQLSDEMVTLLMVQRAYSANAQVVQAGDQLMSIINNLRR